MSGRCLLARRKYWSVKWEPDALTIIRQQVTQTINLCVQMAQNGAQRLRRPLCKRA